MKFIIRFKHPDADLQIPMLKDSVEGLKTHLANENVFRKFTMWREEVEIEFDSETMTAKVLQQNQV